MDIKPLKIYQKTVNTSYGRCIQGHTQKYDYYVYVAQNAVSKAIQHKLYVVNKIGCEGKKNWVKSFLRFFNKDKMVKEIRSTNDRMV